MNAKQFTLVVVLGACSVGFGAFGAHALKNILNDYQTEIWNKAVFYHSSYSIVLLAVLLYQKSVQTTAFTQSINCFLAGIFFFSFSLYALALTQAFGLNMNWLGAVTPIGGVALMLGWIFLIKDIKRS